MSACWCLSAVSMWAGNSYTLQMLQPTTLTKLSRVPMAGVKSGMKHLILESISTWGCMLTVSMRTHIKSSIDFLNDIYT